MWRWSERVALPGARQPRAKAEGLLYQLTAANGTVTRFLYDGDALVAEYDSAGAMTRRYVHWDGADVPIISYTGAGLTAPSYLHADHQGSIVAMSGAAGVIQINRYDEYGIPAATNGGRFQYTGQVWLAELGMYYYKARIYSPTFGRFLQTDRIGYAGGINLYGYVGDDPINGADPAGEAAVTCGSRLGISASCSGGTILGLIGDWRDKRARASARSASASSHAASTLDDLLDFSIWAEFADNAQTFREIGIEGERAAYRYLEAHGYKILATHLIVKTPLGVRIIDIVALPRGGLDAVAYEVKANYASRSLYQRAQDEHIRINGANVRSRGNPFFPQGTQIQLPTGQLNVICMTGCER